jgi:ATP-dependent DNA helicase RecQ
VAAQKFLSCVYRAKQKSGFGFGLSHIVAILIGADTELIRKWRHNEISTYGIGKEMKRAEWQAIGRELVRLGYLRQTAEKFPVLELTAEGVEVLTKRKTVLLTKMMEEKPDTTRRAGDIPCDEVLFDRLRALRRRIADEQDVPAYIIFSDVTLREMANRYPETEDDFARLSGVGKRKLEEYAEPFIEEITEYLKRNPRQIFSDSFTMPTAPAKPRITETVRQSVTLLKSGLKPADIAERRSLVIGTIYGHLATAIDCG